MERWRDSSDHYPAARLQWQVCVCHRHRCDWLHSNARIHSKIRGLLCWLCRFQRLEPRQRVS
jgi:hypothetical protein